MLIAILSGSTAAPIAAASVNPFIFRSRPPQHQIVQTAGLLDQQVLMDHDQPVLDVDACITQSHFSLAWMIGLNIPATAASRWSRTISFPWLLMEIRSWASVLSPTRDSTYFH